MSDHLTLLRPDDWHLHLRDGAALATTVPAAAAQFARVLAMPNLTPPLVTTAQALDYEARIRAHVPAGLSFAPRLALYLTPALDRDEARRAADSGVVLACKLYPAGATTNSEAGVADLESVYPALEALQEADLPLCVHGESIDPSVDVFDRERVFVEDSLAPLVERFPDLRVVLEHITTAEAAAFVQSAREGVAATITPQHLLMNRNDLFAGGLRPHHYCLPVLKRSSHQEALLAAATSGSPRFFLGTDSAPHATGAKESACGCAGCYSSPAALSLYAQAFEQEGALERLEPFAAHFGADFYRLPRGTERVRLERRAWSVPERLPYVEGETITPYWAGRELAWSGPSAV